MTVKKTVSRTLTYIGVIFVCVVILTPFVIMLSYSFRSTKDIFALDYSLIPDNPTLDAYKNAIFNYKFSGYGFGTWTLNSIWICALATFLAVFFSAMMGYAIARFKFTGKKIFMFLISLTQTIPWIIILIPYYMSISSMKLTNNLWVLMITYCAVLMPTAAWLFVGFFKKIPYEVEEAAAIDGCSQWGIFFRIIIPVSLSSVSAIALVSFVTAWGDYLFSSTFIKKAAYWTLPLGLTSFKGEFFIQWAEIMAMSTLVTVPIVALFIFLQRYLVDMMTGSVKQ